MTVKAARPSVPAWVETTLSAIGDLYCGQSPPTEAVNREGLGTPYITGPEQWDGSKLRVDKWTTQPRRLVPDGCIFITVKGAGVGTIFPGTAGAIGRDVYAFHPNPEVSHRFVEHAVRYTVSELVRRAVGDIPGLSKNHILDHPITLPPRGQQDRIVAELERQISRLDSAVAALARASSEVASYRAAVLKAACEGRLVPTEAELARAEGREYETADQLLARILKERRARWEADQLAKLTAKDKRPKDDAWKKKYVEPALPETRELPPLPEGWAWATLQGIAEIKGGITKGQRRSTSARVRSVPYLRVANVQRGYLDLSEIKEIQATEEEIAELKLVCGDVLFNEGGDRDKLGRGWIWNEEIPECIHQNHVFRARVLGGVIAAKLLSWHGNTFGQRYFEQQGKQTTNLASINITKLGMLPIPVPPIAEQRRIVTEVERRLSIADEAEATIETALKRTDRLRQAILKRAFEGRLVPQDPNDEPASVLLERIRKQREAQTQAKARQRSPRRSSGRRKVRPGVTASVTRGCHAIAVPRRHP